MLSSERELYKGRIALLESKIKKLREDNRMLTGINAQFKHQIKPLEDLYFNSGNNSCVKNPSFANIIQWVERLLKRYKRRSDGRTI